MKINQMKTTPNHNLKQFIQHRLFYGWLCYQRWLSPSTAPGGLADTRAFFCNPTAHHTVRILLFFHYSLTETLLKPSNIFPHHLNVFFCPVESPIVSQPFQPHSLLLCKRESANHKHHTNVSGADRQSWRLAGDPNFILHLRTSTLCLRTQAHKTGL